MNEMTRVMLCEDELLFAADLEQRLQRWGFTITGIAANSAAALELADATKPELAIMDFRLDGEMTGAELAALLNFKFGIPSMFLTAYSDDETLKRISATDALGYLVKPVSDRELEPALRFAGAKARAMRNVEATGHAFAGELENLYRVLSSGQDALGRKASEKTFKKVAAEVAHHLNNSLTALLGNIEALGDSASVAPTLQPYIRRLKSACASQELFVRRLLWAAQAGHYSWAVGDLMEIAGRSLKRMEGSVPAGIRLVSDLPNEPMQIFACSDALEEALHGLLKNAIQALGKTGSVILRTGSQYINAADGVFPGARTGLYYLVSVRDSGCGITEEELKQVTDQLFAALPGGVMPGLGMSVARGVAKAHGGGFKVSSKVDHGTTATIYIPALENSWTLKNGNRGSPIESEINGLSEDAFRRKSEAVFGPRTFGFL